MPIDDLPVKDKSVPLEHHARTRLQFLTWMNESVPELILETTQQKALDRSPARDAGAQKAGRKYLRVVDNEEISVAKKLGKTGHRGVLDLAAALAQDQQLR